MRRDILQYLADTALIEKMSEPTELEKQAGLFNELGLGGIASSIKSFFRGKDLLDVMIPGVLFKIHPVFSLANFVAGKFLGFDIHDVLMAIWRPIKAKIEQGVPISPDEINNIGKDVINNLGGGMSATASSNLLEHLYTLEEEGFFTKEAYTRMPRNIKFFGSRRGNRWASVFGDLLRLPRRGKLVWLIGGIIIWTLKTALLGAGLLAGAEAISGMTSNVSKPEIEEVPPFSAPEKDVEPNNRQNYGDYVGGPTYVSGPTSGQTRPAVYRPSSSPFRESSFGKKRFPNDKNNVWMVPLINRSIDDTLLTWTTKVYPELAGKEHLIESANSFQNAVADMEQNFDPKSNNISVPERINNKNVHSIKEIVDTYIKEVARMVKV